MDAPRSLHGFERLCQHQCELLATDTHCHLERFPRPQEVLARSHEAGVGVIAVTSRPSDFRMLFPLFGRREGVRLALGLHPLEVAKVDLRRELDLFTSYAAHTSYIGEIGLDFSPEGRRSRLAQEKALDTMLGVPGVPAKVMTLHSRGAAGTLIERICRASAARAILHWYSGSLSDLRIAVAAGLYFSINPAMTRSAKGRTIIEHLPPDRVLVESDGPFARLDGRPVEPRDVWSVIDHLAREWRRTRDETVAQLTVNLREITAGLSGPTAGQFRAARR